MRYYSFRLLFAVLLITQLSVFNLAQIKQDAANQPLEQGKPIERELKGGEIHNYIFKPEAGQFVAIIVDQRGIDVVAVLFAPDGKQLAEVDSPNGSKGPESVLFVAKESGNYRLEVRPLEKTATGLYEIKIDAFRTATLQEIKQDKIKNLAAALVSANTEEARAALLANDKELVTAELVRELHEYGRRFRSQRNYPSALAISRLALGLAEQLGDKIGISDALYSIGTIFFNQRDGTQALEYQQKSLVLRESLGDKTKIADSLNVIGSIYNQQNNPSKALEYYQRSLALYLETGDKQSIGGIYFNIANTYQRGGDNAQAQEAFLKSLLFIEATGNKALLANTLFNLGLTNFLLGNYAQALDYYRKGLRLFEELENKMQVASTLNRMSLVYNVQGDFALALEYAQKSLTLGEQLDNKQLMANILLTNGLVHGSLSNSTRALEFYQKSLALGEELGNKELIANALEKIGGNHFSQGNIAQAIEYYQKSLKLNEELKNKRQIAFTTVAIGEVYRYQGNYSQALEYFHRSLKVSEELGNKLQIANALNKIGIVYFYQGNYEYALEYFQKGLALREEINNAGGIIDSVNNIGSINLSKGNYAQALEYYQRSLKLSEKIGSKSGMRDALNNIGEVYRLQGNYTQAMEYSQKSLALSAELGNKLVIPETLTIIGNIYFSQGNYAQALEYAERAATIARQTNNRFYLWNALVTAGEAYRALKQFDKSRQAFEEAILTIELSRASIAGQEARATYFAKSQRPYELYIDLLMQMHQEQPNEGYDGMALQISERARARSLLELLNESRADIKQGVVPDLLERERSLQQQLNARAESQTRLLSGKYTEEQASILKKEIDALTIEYQNIEAQIRQKSPRYAALTQPEPLKLSGIQQEMLDRDTILLEYSLGEKRSYLWAVTKDSIKSYELPPRSEIEAAVKRVYALVSDGKLVIDDKAQAEYEREAARLSEILLAPVAAQLQNKRILVVADGALQYLPFGALPKTKNQPLIVENEIISLPSASTLVSLRRQMQGRATASKTLAVFADPVFSATDGRVKVTNPTTKPTSLTQNTALERAASNTGVLRDGIISRLPFSRREAESILAVIPVGEKMQALDFQANRTTALSSEMSQYRILHFATHGLLNSEHPELSGIVLSLVNEQGQTIDGFLRLNEIYNLNLSADLVVLSACQTALGKEIKGEGLIGLTRGFMYAGSPRVVASLWKVDDVATAELMKLFYQKMLQEKMRPAAALRAAKVEMLKQKRWNAPFYWAAFEIQGEWR